MRLSIVATAMALTFPVLAGCRADEALKPPPPPPVPSGGAMFQRYVSMGNSITSGFQSAGINDSTQQRSYAVLLAHAMGNANFVYPSLAGASLAGFDGCPPPFVNNVTQVRVGGALLGTDCGLRVNNVLPNNVAVPGARAEEILSNLGVPTSNSNALTFFFLGGRTQVQAMALQKPTFVSLWIGANDVLGALTSLTNAGDSTLITPAANFTQEYDSVVTALVATGANVVLLNIPDVTIIPYASLAAIYYCAKNGGCPPPFPPQNPLLAGVPTFTVNANCSPLGLGTTTLIPWPIALTKLGAALQGSPQEIDCTVDAEVISGAEVGAMRTAVASYNAHIASVAAANNWALVDINAALQFQRDSVPGAVLPFPDVSALPAGPITFGTLFTLDGVHPSSLAHELIADSVASAINATYGTTLPVPVCGTVVCPAP